MRVLATFLVLALAGAGTTLADGVVTGLVLDGRTGQPLRGATVALGDAQATADLNGVFQATVPAGTWTATVSYEGYETQNVLDVVVADGQTANFSAVLMPLGDDPEGDSVAGDTATGISEVITVEAEAAVATEAALLAERRAAPQILDNIGSEEMSKNTGSDAAGALKRVTGITLQDSKYIYVRGLGDRYSNTQLNGSKIPTTEFERKVVPLDLFPADLLEKVTVSKSYTADQPGDFVAGVVELETKQFPPRQRISIGGGIGWNAETTGDPLSEYPGGLSFSGAGGQALPAGIPDERLVRLSPITGQGFTAAELEGFGELLLGDWTPAHQGPNDLARPGSDAPFNSDLNFSYGNSFDRVGLVLSGSWSDDFQTRAEERNFYVLASGGVPAALDTYHFDYGEQQTRNSLMGNLGLRPSDNSQVGVRALQTTLSNAEGRFQTGFYSDFQNDIEDFRLHYQDRQVTALQLSGDHFLGDLGGAGTLLDWRASSSQAETDENIRQTVYEVVREEFTLTNDGQAGFFFYNDLRDDLADGRFNWSTLWSGEHSYGTGKAGVAYTTRDRDFAGRRFRYFPRSVSRVDMTLPGEQIFTPETVGPNFEIREITNPTDSYDGSHEVGAAYLQGDYSWGKWRVVAGARFEDSQQEVVTLDRRDAGQTPVVTVLDDNDLLPAASLVYSLSSRMSLRGSASRNLNRPEFRELAPFQFTHILGGYNVVGNPELENASIDSFDVRWEWFPRGSEVVAASVFFKSFDNPIEEIVIGGAEPTQTFDNALGARNQGFELEYRRSLGVISERLSSFTTIVNYTFVDSEIEIDPETTTATNTKRPLASQPDNTFNLVLEWAPAKGKTTVRALYNFVDDKIYLAGALGLPDVVEEARGTFDIVWRQGLWQGLFLKVSGTNLTEEEREWSQGGSKNLWRGYQPGRTFDLSFDYAF